METVPGFDGGGAVEAGLRCGGHVRVAPAGGVGEDELAAVARRSAEDVGIAWWCRPPQDPVRPQPGQYLHRQITQEPRQSGTVVAGIGDDEDVWVSLLPLSGGDEPVQKVTELGGGDRGSIVAGARRWKSSGAVHELRPGSSAAIIE